MKDLTPGESLAMQQTLDGVSEAAKGIGGRFGENHEAAASVLKGMQVPDALKEALGKLDDSLHGELLDAVVAGNAEYAALHGRPADASLTIAALSRFVADQTPRRDLGIAMDSIASASNLHSENISLQPAAAILAVMNMFSEAHPHAAYLPTDVKSNEARLMIAEHLIGSDFGDYAQGDSLNGVYSGGAYFEGERFLSLGKAGGASYSVTVTARIGQAASASNPALPLLRGRTTVCVNGRPRAAEVRQSNGSGPNTIAGSVTLAGTTYSITGSSNSDTGDVTFTFSPALPAGHEVHVIAYIDYERQPELAPAIDFRAEVYQLFAHASRGRTLLSFDAQSQFSMEAGLDAASQQQLALRNQFAGERFYRAHQKLMAMAVAAQTDWDYDFATQIAQKDYAQLWFALAPILARESQLMVERNNDHGIDTLYMTGELSALCRGLPSTIWQSSGIVNRPGVYRMGRLFNLYDAYYVPSGHGLVDDPVAGTSQILCVGRGSSVVRNPLVMGDAVPTMLIPIAQQSDLRQRFAMYDRSFTEINPHALSQEASVILNVTGMK